MIDFFPLLDAVNDILLVVLHRDRIEDREGELLTEWVEHFKLRPPIAVGYDPNWAARRRNWIEELAPILGWPFSAETST
jgi:hypothetical protein